MTGTPRDQDPPPPTRGAGELTAPARADRLPRRGGPRGPSWSETPVRTSTSAGLGKAVTLLLWLLAALGVAIAALVLRAPTP